MYFQEDFTWWAQQGRELLDLHLGFETYEPWPLERQDKAGATPKRTVLRADKEKGVIRLDNQTSLTGVPSEAWGGPVGHSLSAGVGTGPVQRKEGQGSHRPRAIQHLPIRGHKERVVDLLGRVCAVSAFTTTIVNELGARSTMTLDNSPSADASAGRESQFARCSVQATYLAPADIVVILPPSAERRKSAQGLAGVHHTLRITRTTLGTRHER